jgi:pimeloyl-ACP methyl ester carboxylesterase
MSGPEARRPSGPLNEGMNASNSGSGRSASCTFVLVHGGCHDGSMWADVAERLEHLGHSAYTPTIAGHGSGVSKNVTHAQSTQSIVDFILENDLSNFLLVGHGYGGSIISKVAELVADRIRRLVFWSAFVLNDGESVFENLPGDVSVYAEMAKESSDNTFMIPFEVWRDTFINDGDPELVRRAYGALSPEPFGPWVERLDMKAFHALDIPRSFVVGTEDLVMPPGQDGWHPRMSRRLGEFRLVRMPGSHEALLTNPISVAHTLIEAGHD